MNIIIALMIIAVASIPLWFVYQKIKQTSQRRVLKTKPFPSSWKSILEEEFPLYNHLPQNLQENLHYKIQVFITEKYFEGCGGFEITDRVKVLVAAQACILLLNKPHRVFPRLTTILIYPSTYIATQKERNGLFETNSATSVAGQSSGWGNQVILAWNHVMGGMANDKDGHNVVFHEFAHQLDSEAGAADGVPRFGKGRSKMYSPWIHIVGDEFSDFVEKVHHHHKDVIDDYGATNGAEFFAVTTETFFEKPYQLAKKHPALFEQFKEYYELDPREWM